MQNLLEDLKKLLAKDEWFTADGELLRNKIVESALKLDEDLVTLLLSHKKLKEHFFTKVGEATIFDKDKFVKFVRHKQLLPDSYTAFKNKIGLTEGDEYISEKKDVVLSWPYKDCVLEGGQTKEDVKRDEVFWNQTLAPDEIDRLLDPKVFTNAKRVDKDGEHDFDKFNRREDGTISDNLIVKGNNLLALHPLKKEFAGKVKLIYIDPPYYFESKKQEDTFSYNSNFKLSTWLTFMKNRLKIARELLAEDGAIFVQINDDGVAELHRLLKEIFNVKGQNNFINKITIKTKSPSGFASINPGVFKTAEYILSFAKNKKEWSYNEQHVKSEYDKNYKWYVPNKDEDHKNWEVEDLFEYIAKDKGYKNKKQAVEELGTTPFYQVVGDFALENADRVFQSTAISNDAASETVKVRDESKKNSDQIYHIQRDDHYDIYVQNGREMAFYSKKVREVDGKLAPSIKLSNIWTDVPYEGISKEGGVTLKRGKKPEKLLKRIVEMASDPGDIVLDFFSGTGTTAAVAHKLGRQWITIEQLENQLRKQHKRLQKVINGDSSGISKSVNWQGGGDYVYLELAKWNQEFVEKIQEAKSKKELEKIWKEMQKRAFLSWRLDFDKLEKNAKEFNDLSLENQKKFLLEVLDQNQLYINYSEIEDEMYGVSEEDKKLNKEFYEQ